MSWRQKAQNAPSVPQQRNDYEIPEAYCSPTTAEKFLPRDSGIDENRVLTVYLRRMMAWKIWILIFATEDGLEDLVRFPNWQQMVLLKLAQQVVLHPYPRGFI